MARARRWQEFGSIILAQRMVRKKCEEGFSLYLQRQSEGTWMKFKCQIKSKRAHLNERGAQARVLVVDQ